MICPRDTHVVTWSGWDPTRVLWVPLAAPTSPHSQPACAPTSHRAIRACYSGCQAPRDLALPASPSRPHPLLLTRHSPAPPAPWLLLHLECSFLPHLPMASSLTSLRSLLECHLLQEASPDHPF